MKKENNILELGIKNLLGVEMIGATSRIVNALPSGTAKDISKIVPGLQSLSLVSENVKSFKIKKSTRRKK